MQYDYSLLTSEPDCFSIEENTFVFYSSDYTKKQSGVLLDGSVYPSSIEETGTFTPQVCLGLENLHHSSYTQFVFPLLSIAICIFIAAMIYHIIIKRLLP